MRMSDWLTDEEMDSIENGVSTEKFKELYIICLNRKKTNSNIMILNTVSVIFSVLVIISTFIMILYLM